jgi:signal transduction histidine kinase
VGVAIHRRDPGWILTLLFGGGALLVAALAVTLRLGAPSELAVIPTEAWPWSATGVAVNPTTDGSALHRGDVVVAMDGRSMEDWVEGWLPLAAAGPNPALASPVEFSVLRDGRPAVVPVTLAPFPLERFGRMPIGLVAFGAGVLAFALVLLARRPRSLVVRLLFIGAAANVADIVVWELGLQPTDFATGPLFLLCFGAGALFNAIFWATILHILAIYPVRSRLVVARPRIVVWLYVVPIGALVGLAILSRLVAGSTLEWMHGLANLVGIVASSMLVAIVAFTLAAYRRASVAVREQVRLVGITLGLAAVATVALLTLPIALTGRPLVARSVVALLAAPVPVALLVAVMRDRLFQVALLTRSRERVVAAREDERRKLRRDLHDGLAPTLAAAGLRLDHARHAVRADPAVAEQAIDQARAELRGAIADIRQISRELRPPAIDSVGLVDALRQQAAGLGVQAGEGPVIIVEAEGTLPPLPAAVEVAAYRIAVEGMMNVVRHAEARHCSVRVEVVGDELQVAVTDDGVGRGSRRTGVGTRSMQERAEEVGGDVRYVQRQEPGTRLLARLPLDLAALARPVT